MKRAAHATLLVIIPTVVACLAMLEAGLRLKGRLPSNVTDGIFEQHGNGYRPRRNVTKISRTPSYECTIHTNELGFRDRSPGPRDLRAPYIAWVGDSITFGNGVDWDDSFVGVFDAKAAPQGVEVLNLAVGGHRLSDEEQRLGEFLDAAPRKPAAVVLVLTAQGMDTFEQPQSDVFVKNGYIFPKKGWLVPFVTVTLGNASSAYCFFRDALRAVLGRLLPPPAAGLEPLKPFARSGRWEGEDVRARFLARLDRLDARIRAAGARPIYVYMPSSVDLRWKDLLSGAGETERAVDLQRYIDLLRRHCEEHGDQLVNLLPLLQARHDAGERLSFPQDPHYNQAANRIVGEALFAEILGARSAPLGAR